MDDKKRRMLITVATVVAAAVAWIALKTLFKSVGG